MPRYRNWRRLWHGIERVATIGGWPARLGARLANRVEVEHHDVRVGRPLGNATSLRVAFASDFHVGPSTPSVLIEQALEQLSRAGADLLLLGGDFVSLDAEYLRDLAPRLGAIPAPLGRYAVLGNHDHWADGSAVAAHLRRAGIDVLTNCCIRLPEPYANISICGLDDHTSGEPNANAAFRDAAEIRIVLMHAPSNLLDVGDRAFTVAFCGHTHGGQIALPNGRPLKVAQGPLSRRYNAGRFDLDSNRTLLVSRGIGYSTIPLRVNAPPAVLICTLTGGSPTD